MIPPMSREELIFWASESLAFYGIDLDRISSVLLLQAHYFEKKRVFDTFELTRPIKKLEKAKLSGSKVKEEKFKHSPLTNLHKIHFTSLRFTPKNMINILESKSGIEQINKIWKKASEVSGAGIFDETFISYFSHHSLIDTLKSRAASDKMTGEWLVYYKHNGFNYYLTFAFHNETNESIYNRVVTSCEFDKLPFQP